MDKFLNKLKISTLTILLKLLYGSGRWKLSGFQNVQQLIVKKESFIIAFWHGNMLVPYFKLAKHNFHILAGLHKDAELGAQIGKKLGWRFLRGSSSNNGSEVFQEIVKYLSKPGNVFAITPDGPKGPMKIPKPGAVRAAQKAGVPIIPAAGFSSRNWKFTNWDTFYVTKPFARINLIFGEPINFTEEDAFTDCVDSLKFHLDSLESVAKKNVLK